MRSPSSDASAKVSAVAVVIILIGVGMASVAGIAFLTSFGSAREYTITITIDDMQVGCESGYVVENVARQVSGTVYYYNPETKDYDLASPSGKAPLFASATIDGKTITSGKVMKNVQTGSPAGGADLGIALDPFEIKTSDGSVDVVIYLMTGTGDSGTLVNIYEGAPGLYGARLQIDLEKGDVEYVLAGDPQSPLVGLLRMTVTVS